MNLTPSSTSPSTAGKAPAPHAVLAGIAMATLLGACATPIPPEAPSPVVTRAFTPAAAPAAAQAQSQPAPQSNVTTVTLPAHLDPKSDIATGRSVYFDFDDARLKSEFAPLIERHGRYLVANPNLAIRVEGNTDERGSAEYNLALGQKRAEAMRNALALIGVPPARMEAVSWGMERPRVGGRDESAYGQNRRADLQYPGK